MRKLEPVLFLLALLSPTSYLLMRVTSSTCSTTPLTWTGGGRGAGERRDSYPQTTSQNKTSKMREEEGKGTCQLRHSLIQCTTHAGENVMVFLLTNKI